MPPVPGRAGGRASSGFRGVLRGVDCDCGEKGQVVREQVEKSFFDRIPGYALIRSLTQQVAGEAVENVWKPALVQTDEGLVGSLRASGVHEWNLVRAPQTEQTLSRIRLRLRRRPPESALTLATEVDCDSEGKKREAPDPERDPEDGREKGIRDARARRHGAQLPFPARTGSFLVVASSTLFERIKPARKNASASISRRTGAPARGIEHLSAAFMRRVLAKDVRGDHLATTGSK